MMMRDLPPEERPRERLLLYGAAALSDADLLAILIRTGTSSASVLELADKVLSKYRGKGLAAIMNMAPQEIADISGIGPAKAATILAAVELGRRISTRAAAKLETVSSPTEAAGYVMPVLRYEMREHFGALLLDNRNHVIFFSIISIGSMTASVVHPREVFREAVRHAAAKIILVHNHPSGDPTPSDCDIQLTRQLTEAGKLMGIPVIDHIIIGDDRFISMKDEGLI